MITIYSWLSDEENMEMNRRENPDIYKKLDKALKILKKKRNDKNKLGITSIEK